jgi:hypothetical protein
VRRTEQDVGRRFLLLIPSDVSALCFLGVVLLDLPLPGAAGGMGSDVIDEDADIEPLCGRPVGVVEAPGLAARVSAAASLVVAAASSSTLLASFSSSITLVEIG